MKPHVPGRWHAQGLDAPRFDTGAAVVRHLGAVQSQLHDMALWAVGRRCGRTLVELQTEFDTGAFVRTHVLRPTWHFVTVDDLPWLQALTSDRVHRLNGPQHRQLGIDDALLAAAREAAPTALAGGPLTRAALAAALVDLGVEVTAARQSHVVMHLEIQGLVASGPMQGKQHTYVLLPGPSAPIPDRDTLLARVAQRYGRGHGAFRARDLAWWTSLTLTEARRAVDLAGLPVAEIDGEAYAIPEAPVASEPPRATLLSNFDEYISYARDHVDVAAIAGSLDLAMRGTGLLLVDGALGGWWQRTLRPTAVDVTVQCTRAPSSRLRQAIEAEAEAFGSFLGREVRLIVAT